MTGYPKARLDFGGKGLDFGGRHHVEHPNDSNALDCHLQDFGGPYYLGELISSGKAHHSPARQPPVRTT